MNHKINEIVISNMSSLDCVVYCLQDTMIKGHLIQFEIYPSL